MFGFSYTKLRKSPYFFQHCRYVAFLNVRNRRHVIFIRFDMFGFLDLPCLVLNVRNRQYGWLQTIGNHEKINYAFDFS